MSNSDTRLVVVEDSDHDFLLLRRCLSKLEIRIPVERFDDADEAFRYVQEFVETASSGKVMVLLDLNLPDTDGRDFLARIKRNESLQTIPVVVFSKSENVKDVQFTYEQGGNGYMVKPMGNDKFLNTIENFKRFWLDTNRLS